MPPNFILLVTTDGSRERELDRLLRSVSQSENLLILLLLQGCEFTINHNLHHSSQLKTIATKNRIPLSTARNIMLDYLSSLKNDGLDLRKSYVLLSDDDCWYSDNFFDNAHFNSAAHIFHVEDPENKKTFSTWNLKKRKKQKEIKNWELMFYAVSISIAIKYDLAEKIRFNEKIGLGNEISQGEESLFLLKVAHNFPDMKFTPRTDLTIFHPWKMASSSKNHDSLGYFLGLVSARGYPEVIPFYLFFLVKYLIASIIRPKALYFKIVYSLLVSFFRGIINTRRVSI